MAEMYWYNGQRFPALPEYDTESYEAAIFQTSFNPQLYILVLQESGSGFCQLEETDDGFLWEFFDSGVFPIQVYRSMSGGSSWMLADSGSLDIEHNPIWTNTEDGGFYNIDGELILKSSTAIPVNLTITYQTAYGTTPETKTIPISAEDSGYVLIAEDLPALSVDGHLFVGWEVNEVPLSVGDILTDHTELVASWDAITLTYVVSGVYDHARPPMPRKVSLENGQYVLTSNDLPVLTPSHDYFMFNGWTVDGTPVRAGDIVTTNTTLTESWLFVQKIIYLSDYGTVPENKTVTSISPGNGYFFTADDLPTLTADGYLHTGWKDMNDVTVSAGTKSTNGLNIPLTAIWEEEPEQPEEPDEPLSFIKFLVSPRKPGLPKNIWGWKMAQRDK